MLRLAILLFGVSLQIHSAAYLYKNSFITGQPAHCGGPKWCSTVAETAFRATRFAHNANQDGFQRVWASNNDVYAEVTCSLGPDSQMHANFKATSESMQSVNFWGARIFKMMQGIRCL